MRLICISAINCFKNVKSEIYKLVKKLKLVEINFATILLLK